MSFLRCVQFSRHIRIVLYKKCPLFEAKTFFMNIRVQRIFTIAEVASYYQLYKTISQRLIANVREHRTLRRIFY